MSERKIIQWNIGLPAKAKYDQTKEKSRLRVLRALLTTYKPSIVALQEANDKVRDLVSSKGYQVERNKELVTGFNKNDWFLNSIPNTSSDRALILLLKSTSGTTDLILTNIHLPSRLHLDKDQQADRAFDVINDIKNLRLQQYNFEEVIIGDFNFNPYESCMVLKNGFYSNRSFDYVIMKSKKEVSPFKPLFNPSWFFFGSGTGAQGSYYNTNGSEAPWYIFDQILLSENLVLKKSKKLQPPKLITKVRQHELIKGSPSYKPDDSVGSDHLPILTKFIVS